MCTSGWLHDLRQKLKSTFFLKNFFFFTSQALSFETTSFEKISINVDFIFLGKQCGAASLNCTFIRILAHCELGWCKGCSSKRSSLWVADINNWFFLVLFVCARTALAMRLVIYFMKPTFIMIRIRLTLVISSVNWKPRISITFSSNFWWFFKVSMQNFFKNHHK